MLFHGGSVDDDGHSLTDDSIGHTTTQDSIYQKGDRCSDPGSRSEVESCLNEFAQRARLATRDYFSMFRRALAATLTGADADAALEVEFGPYVEEHLSLCPDAG